MTYKQIKWLILIIPTLTIGAWEYVRHEFLLPYISMELGNWLAPLIVLMVSLLFLTKLFRMIEHNQEELNRAKALQAVMEEREKIARELHDGIAQSLFLLSVKADRLERLQPSDPDDPARRLYGELRKTIRELNDYVRQAIANLRQPPAPRPAPWTDLVRGFVTQFRDETGMEVHFRWDIREERLAPKEKVELFSSIREALLNIQKHARARTVWVEGGEEAEGWYCFIADDGVGFAADPFLAPDRYGLKIMRERAKEMGWDLRFRRHDGKTVLQLRKGGAA